MADIRGSYDENAEPSSGEFEPIPAGEYRAVIVESSWEDVSKQNNNGRCLVLKWQIETGPYADRLIWQRLNLQFTGKNEDKVKSIANAQFSALRQAVGQMMVNDSDQLHHRPCNIRVAVRTDPTGRYAPSNEVKATKPVENQSGGNSRQQADNQQRNAPPANSSQGSAPWRKTG